MNKNNLEIQVDETPFKKNKRMLILLTFFTLLNAILATLVMRGAFSDGIVFLMTILNSLSNGQYGIASDVSQHTRLFINLINQFPINFAHNFLGIHNKQILMMLYSFPLYVFPLLALIFNCMLSKRTKRFDIAIIGLGIYFLAVASSALYSVVELRLATVFYLILFNYLAGKINYTKFDIGAILFLILMLFNSHELVIIIGPIFFLISFYYAKNEENKFNKNVKRFIGYSSLSASLYLVYWFYTKPVTGEAFRYLQEAQISLLNIKESFGILTFISLFLISLCIFYKKYFSKYIIMGLTCLYSGILIWVYLNLTTYLNSNLFFAIRTWPCFVLPVALILVFIIDYFRLKVGNIFYTNILTIICFTGILYSIWQINHSYYFYKDYKYFQNKMDTISKVMVTPDEVSDIYSRLERRRYHFMNTFTTESILFSDKFKINHIVVPEKVSSGYSEKYQCYVYLKDYKFYVDKSGILHLPYINIDVKNDFWDLTDITKELEKNKNKYEIR